MGMGTHVEGFRPPDETFKKMKVVYDACIAANVEVPDEVVNFFESLPPDKNGVKVDISKASKEWKDGDACMGIEVDVTKLPEGVKIIRFANCW
jgi:hypothetical protein